MWQARIEEIDNGNIELFSILEDSDPISFEDVISLWKDSASFREYFTSLLVDCSFAAFRWETPCVDTSTLDRNFQFALLRCDQLDRRVDPHSFKDQFETELQVTAFPSLRGDAVLVVPGPSSDLGHYVHIASFVRGAPKDQIHELWKQIADTMRQTVAKRPTWLNTAGMGVAWLHVRLDSKPKYYGYEPFKKRL